MTKVEPKMSYSADAVANEFLDGRMKEIDPMKLQKLVYYAHAWSLALFNEPLVGERIEAWEFGPVFPSLYGEFKEFKTKKIDRFALEFDDNLNEVTPRLPEDAIRAKGLIKRVWELLGHYTGIQLSNMSHSENEPWSKIPKKRPGLAIPDSLIKDCFQKMLPSNS